MALERLGIGGILTFDERPAVRGMAKGRDALGRFTKSAKQVEGPVGRVSSSFSSFGVVLRTAGVIGGLAAIAASFRKLIRLTSEFEMSMAKINTLLDESSPPIKAMSKDILKMSDTYGVATEDMTEGMFQAISAGVDAADSLEFMTIASKAAVGGFTKVETAVEGLTTFMNVYGIKSMKEMKRVSDSVFMANKLGKTTFEEISASVGRAAATAKGAGISYNELLSTVVAVTKGGISTSESMSGLKAVLAGIAKPTKEAQEEAKRLGLEFNTAAVQTKGWTEFLKELAEETEGDKKSIEKLFGSIEAGNIMMTLAAKGGFADFIEAMEAMRKGAGATEEAFKKVAATSTHQWRRMTTAIANAAIRLGNRLFESFSETFDNIADSISGFSQALDEVMDIDWSNVEQSQKRVSELTKKYGKSTMRTAMLVSGAIDIIKGAWKVLTTVVGVVFKILDATVGAFFRGFMEFFAPLRLAIQDLANAFGQLFGTLFGWLIDSTESSTDSMAGMFRIFGKNVAGMLTEIVKGLAFIFQLLDKAVKESRSFIEKTTASAVEQAARGLAAVGIISDETAARQIKTARFVAKQVDEQRRIERDAFHKRLEELAKIGQVQAEVGVEGTRATKEAAKAAAEARKKPPPLNINLENHMCIDGRDVSHAVQRQQTEIQERAGFRTTPWQRRMSMEHGAMPATVGVRSS